MIDLLLSETQCTTEAVMRLSCQITVAINCWHTWHRIDTAWRGLSGGRYTATTTVMVCLDPRVYMVFTIYMLWLFGSQLVTSLSQLRLAPNKTCMSLVITIITLILFNFLVPPAGKINILRYVTLLYIYNEKYFSERQFSYIVRVLTWRA